MNAEHILTGAGPYGVSHNQLVSCYSSIRMCVWFFWSMSTGDGSKSQPTGD